MRRQARLELREARVPRGLADEPAGALVVRMAVLRPRREDEARPGAADGLDDAELRGAVRPEVAVPEVEVHAEARAEDSGGLGRLRRARLGSPARRHLAAREVDDADAAPAAGEGGERPAAAELDVVRVRAEREDVHGNGGVEVHSTISCRPGSSHFRSRRSAPTTAALPSFRTYGRTG